MAEATRSPIFDRRVVPASEDAIVAGGIAIPRAGDATVEVDGRLLRLTSLDRSLYPALPGEPFTKADLIAYWLGIAPVILPLLEERALTVGRFPGGVDGRGFAQSEVPGRPPWLRAERLALAKGGTKLFTICEERASLAWLGQMGVIELHSFLGRVSDLEHPTHVVFDLDPTPPSSLLDAARVALLLRERLVARGIAASAKCSGSAGMHVLVPVGVFEGRVDYPRARAFAAEIASELAAAQPDLVSDRMDRASRAGRVLVDARQNAARLTTVLPWSLRATARPTVSVPLAWEEIASAVEAADAGSLVFLARDALARAGASGG